ncbi:glutaredoxin-like protein NrdH [Lapidilactobacillus bayanensis]|uniref:glutaredoxin-like protein NrdH n=1 Tax=Lapidilactobacillus bayanensis TaxID=2485998 RepID=UPI001CDBEADB|nr:glutaredoxin-like protein NrdH [Lapidilactobacillus bayanensis]
MTNHKVVIYTRNGCMQCKMTERYLNEHQIGYQEVNIDENPESANYLREKGFKSVPIVFREDAQPIIGFQPAVLRELVG